MVDFTIFEGAQLGAVDIVYGHGSTHTLVVDIDEDALANLSARNDGQAVALS